MCRRTAAFDGMVLAAVRAGISVKYYTRLERGSAAGVSEDVLEGITRALQLDDTERAPATFPAVGQHGGIQGGTRWQTS